MWHASQEIEEAANGAVLVTLNVSNDFALRSWILGFGPLAKVVSPASLAAQIVEEIEQTRRRYGPEADTTARRLDDTKP
jgi:predicted DNA-binding transcriptional regulator YafY